MNFLFHLFARAGQIVERNLSDACPKQHDEIHGLGGAQDVDLVCEQKSLRRW